MKAKNYQELEIGKEGIDHLELICILTQNVSFKYDFALNDQMRRSAISISLHIAEGFEKNSTAEFKRFQNFQGDYGL